MYSQQDGKDYYQGKVGMQERRVPRMKAGLGAALRTSI
jgi:hypothetical protein